MTSSRTPDGRAFPTRMPTSVLTCQVAHIDAAAPM